VPVRNVGVSQCLYTFICVVLELGINLSFIGQ
jgi:hypothetical protein